MSDNIFITLEKELPGIKKGVLLSEYTTFKIGGPAEYFFIASRQEELLKAIAVAKKLEVPVFVLGGGSNLLVSDDGVKGLVIKIQNSDITLLDNNVISAGAGAVLADVVSFSIDHSLEGLEWAGGLPGSFGGAIRGNAGAFGGETKDSVVQVSALDDSLDLKQFSNEESQFSYRNSIFKKNNWPVVSAKIQLKLGDKEKLQEIANSRMEYRKERHPLDFPNAGSIFKNVDLNAFSLEMQNQLSAVVKKDPFPVIPTAYLISEAGLKGIKVGQAQVSEKHPNFIVNLGGAKAKDVSDLINVVKRKIKEVYNIELETEVQFVGF